VELRDALQVHAKQMDSVFTFTYKHTTNNPTQSKLNFEEAMFWDYIELCRDPRNTKLAVFLLTQTSFIHGISFRSKIILQHALETHHPNKEILDALYRHVQTNPKQKMRAYEDQLFLTICALGYTKSALYLQKKHPRVYKLTVSNNSIVSYQIISLSRKPVEAETINVERDECVVCYDPAEVVSACGHQYCKGCSIKLFKQNKTCSYCRQCVTPLRNIDISFVQKPLPTVHINAVY